MISTNLVQYTEALAIILTLLLARNLIARTLDNYDLRQQQRQRLWRQRKELHALHTLFGVRCSFGDRSSSGTCRGSRKCERADTARCIHEIR